RSNQVSSIIGRRSGTRAAAPVAAVIRPCCRSTIPSTPPGVKPLSTDRASGANAASNRGVSCSLPWLSNPPVILIARQLLRVHQSAAQKSVLAGEKGRGGLAGQAA